MIIFMCTLIPDSAYSMELTTMDEIKMEHNEILSAINNVRIEKVGGRNKGVLTSYSTDLRPVQHESEAAILKRFEEILARRGWLKYEVKVPQKTITFCRNSHNFAEISFKLYQKTGTYYFAVTWYKDVDHFMPCKLEPGSNIVKGITDDSSFDGLLVLFLIAFIVTILIYINRKKLHNIKWPEN